MRKWYALHTYASHEFKVRESILKGIEGTRLDDLVEEILIPTQKTFHIREGKKVEREKKLFPSYIVIKADLTQELFNFIVRLPSVTNFLGSGKKATPLSEAEVNRLLGIAEREKNDVSGYEFLPGDIVKVIAGPFTDFEGTVEKVDPDSNKLIVKVTVFGRVTPVEVSSDDIEVIK